MAEEAERVHADLARKAKDRELHARKQFKVFSAVEMSSQSKDIVNTRWELTWQEVEGSKTVKARFAA